MSSADSAALDGTMPMTSIWKGLLVAGGTTALIVAVIWGTLHRQHVSSPEYRFTQAFEQVEAGMQQQQVLTLLGPADETGRHFRLAQARGFEDAYRRAARGGAESYWFWRRGIDMVYAIGLDADQKVVVAEYGGT